MRYRAEPCGNGGCPAMWRVVDGELSPVGTSICEATAAHAKKIVHALNLAEDSKAVAEIASA